MPVYNPPLRDMQFVMHEVLNVEAELKAGRLREGQELARLINERLDNMTTEVTTLRALVPPYIIRQGLVIVLLGALAAIGMGVNATLAMMVALLGTFAAAACQLVLVVPALLRLFPATTPRYDLPAWRMAAVPMLLSDLAVLGRLAFSRPEPIKLD